MEIITEDDFSGVQEDHPMAEHFTVLGYASGGPQCRRRSREKPFRFLLFGPIIVS